MNREDQKLDYENVQLDIRAVRVMEDILKMSNEINSYKKDYENTESDSTLLSKLIIKEFQLVNYAYEEYKKYIEENGEESYRMIVNQDFNIDIDPEN